MAKDTRTFVAGRMNKVVDQRLLPEGEYVDAMNVRMGDTEKSEVGVIENTKGNIPLSTLRYIDGTQLSLNARCIGAIEDSANETIYWFVHDDSFFGQDDQLHILDMIVSLNINTNALTYHVISIGDINNRPILNFNSGYLITGVNKIEDLLFFTDDYNPPRVINVTRNYPNPISYVDQITAESILVIKKPPMESPVIQLIRTAGSSNYMDTRFICFAYRYKYADGEYSATSQWSEPAFSPKQFNFSINSLLNEGMENFYNAAIINYNSGSELVVAVELLFKQSNNNVIKVIEVIDKADLGDDQIYQYTFSNSKIFTILPDSELLRLYDNVPRFAKAQTIMGNRLMYGNYVEGYNLIDKNGQDVLFDYSTTLISEPVGEESLLYIPGSGDYNLEGKAASVPNASVYVDLSNVDLIAGSSLNISFTFVHYSFVGTNVPTQTTDTTRVSFTFVLPTSYNSPYEMVNSTEFINAVGYGSLFFGNIEPMATSCDGITFTDQINCLTPTNLTNATTTYTKQYSGVNVNFFTRNYGCAILSDPGTNVIGLQVIGTLYKDDASANTVAEFYTINFAEITYQKIASPSSLHSNRGYEVGIVYMDDFNRASTALVSKNNTEHIPCGYSIYQNSIQVNIPVSQRAPNWASRYKFVIKPDEAGYETIYSNIFFIDKDTNDAYFLLEGENARKVEDGDRFIVKRDSDGPTSACIYATVLEKKSQQSAFITTVSGAVPPTGVYMKINPSSFSAVQDPNSIIAYGRQGGYVDAARTCPVFYYPMSYPTPDGGGMYTDYDVPAGSRIVINILFDRGGRGCSCEKRRYELNKSLTASSNYANMEDWFLGDNVQAILGDGDWQGSCGAAAPANVFQTGHGAPSCALDTNYYRFNRDANNRLYFQGSGTWACSGAGTAGRRSFAYATITVYRADSLFIFETEPADALPDVFFENDLSFAIDEDGNHMGNVQDQDINMGVPAIVNTGFYNCFSFGNGAESYKIRDSIVGRQFDLGQRVTSVSAQQYKEASRFSDITYSGIYNPESNINKLNEFNLGLLDYKHLEASFGDIYLMDGRETDVLVLQEDKISYVLAGKNLLSDAAAGSAITSVPEVLGTQIARTEKYGISFNPESYVQWGFNRFFTDAKRGAVIQLMGTSYANDDLGVISDANMRTWFRDEFNNSFNTQKLGGFDPYMNEYVLSSNTINIPAKVQCIACGVTQNLKVSGNTLFEYCVNLGSAVGDSNISWVVEGEDSVFRIFVTYDGNEFESEPQTGSGSFSFSKNSIAEQTAIIGINNNQGASLDISITVDCPEPEIVNVVQVVVTNDSDSGDTVHAEYRYTSGIFVSPLQSNLVTFASGTTNPLVSRYNITTGAAGTGGFPIAGSTLTIQSNQIPPDTFVFNPALDKFRYLRSNTLYNNNAIDISTLLASSTLVTGVIGSGTLYSGDFTVPSTGSGSYIYLIWDFRKSYPLSLCYSDESNTDACCNCDVF